MFFIAIVAVFFGGFVTSLPAIEQQPTDGPPCNNPLIMNCKQFPLFNYTDFRVIDKKEDFVDNCPYKNYEQHLLCVDLYTRRCMTTKQRKTFYKMYSRPAADIDNICVGGTSQDEYLKHAPCLKTVHKEYEECGNKNQNEIRRIMDTNSSVSHTQPAQDYYINDNLKHLCGSFRGYLQCVHNIVKSTCGESTVAFTNKFLTNMATSLLTLCEQHSIDMQIESITSRSSRTMNPVHGFLFILLVGFLLLK